MACYSLTTRGAQLLHTHCNGDHNCEIKQTFDSSNEVLSAFCCGYIIMKQPLAVP